jgi:glycosyltransferase involved in cell wall biosynthesis
VLKGNKLKIAWLCPFPVNFLPHELTGVSKTKIFHPATWLVNLSQALAKHEDIELHIITLTPWVLKDTSFLYNGITFHIARCLYSIPFKTSGLPSWLLAGVRTKYWLDVVRCKKILKQISPDIVHAHGTEIQYAHIAVNSEYPVVITLQGIIGFLNKIRKKKGGELQEKIEQSDIRNCKYFISHARFATEYIKELNPTATIEYIDDIVSEGLFNRKRRPQPFKILFVGSVLRSKGIEDLINALNIVRRTHNFTITVVGHCGAKYKKKIMARIKAMDLKKNVIFVGHIPDEKLLEHYETAGLFVFPSHFETSPNVIMEAMSIGLPIVTTRIGGIPDMITHHETGILVEVGNAPALAEAINYVLNNPTVAEVLGSNARIEASNRFRENIVAEKIVKYYYQIAESTLQN